MPINKYQKYRVETAGEFQRNYFKSQFELKSVDKMAGDLDLNGNSLSIFSFAGLLNSITSASQTNRGMVQCFIVKLRLVKPLELCGLTRPINNNLLTLPFFIGWNNLFI